MAKKIYFKTVNKETTDTINTILDVIFAHTFVSKELYTQGKSLEKQIEDLLGAVALGEDKSEELDKARRELNIVGFKKKAIVAWRKETLYNRKDETGKNWINGLYSEIGVTPELAETWAECYSAQTWGKWNDNIRKMLADVYGMDIKDDKLVAKFASYLEHLIAPDPATSKDILKGILIKDSKSFNKFAEMFVKGIATYMSKSTEEVNIPSVEFYSARVEYDTNYTKVVDYDVFEKVSEEKAESAPTTEEPKEEKVA